MTNATHTPGAWATDGREAAWDILGGDNNRIASVWRNVGKPQDARLIAAAPDLLAALENAVFAMESAIILRGLDEFVPYADAAHKAIKKAKGE